MAERHQQPAQATVADAMTAHPTCCTPETPVERVAQLMVLQNCGEIPVVDHETTRVPIGVVTDRDIVCRVLARGRNPLKETAADCMSEPVVTVDETASLDEAVSAMEKHQIRRMPVVNARGQCVGIVSQADVAWSGPKDDVADLVREVSRDSGDASR